jgi:hypothetical protein
MNIFKPTTFTWSQLYEFKWAVFLIGIAIGAFWPQIFAPYAIWILILGLLISIAPAIAWFREHSTGA